MGHETPPFHVVLVEPEIPPNTGNIARTCAATGCWLHLVHPLGFSTRDKDLKRAGLDYWPEVTVREWPGLSVFEEGFAVQFPEARWWLFSAHSAAWTGAVGMRAGDALIFGSETRGLPPDLMERHAQRVLRLPMREGTRSLNLASAATAAVYLAFRETGVQLS